MRNLILIFTFFMMSTVIMAQELNCDVQINTDQIENSNKSVFEAPVLPFEPSGVAGFSESPTGVNWLLITSRFS